MNTTPGDAPVSHALLNVRRGYVSPQLVIHGSVEELTMGGANGHTLDKNFKGSNNRHIHGALELS